MKTSNLSSSNTIVTLIIIATLFVLGALFAYIFNFGAYFSDNQSDWAHFGDYFGGLVGPVMALSGFCALLVTINLQSRALEVSQTELSLTRDELRKTAQAAVDQSQYFSEKSYIDDCISVIQEIQSNFYELKGAQIKIAKANGFASINFSQFLRKEFSHEEIFSFGRNLGSSGRTLNLSPAESTIRSLMKTLNRQIKNLKDTESAKEQYIFYMSNYFWVFMALYQTGVVNWYWKDMLDEEHKNILDSFLQEQCT